MPEGVRRQSLPPSCGSELSPQHPVSAPLSGRPASPPGFWCARLGATPPPAPPVPVGNCTAHAARHPGAMLLPTGQQRRREGTESPEPGASPSWVSRPPGMGTRTEGRGAAGPPGEGGRRGEAQSWRSAECRGSHSRTEAFPSLSPTFNVPQCSGHVFPGKSDKFPVRPSHRHCTVPRMCPWQVSAVAT